MLLFGVFLMPYRLHADLFLSEAIGHAPGCLETDSRHRDTNQFWYTFASKGDVEEALEDAREHGYRVVRWCRCAGCLNG